MLHFSFPLPFYTFYFRTDLWAGARRNTLPRSAFLSVDDVARGQLNLRILMSFAASALRFGPLVRERKAREEIPFVSDSSPFVFPY